MDVWNQVRLHVQLEFISSPKKNKETFTRICQLYYNQLIHSYPTE